MAGKQREESSKTVSLPVAEFDSSRKLLVVLVASGDLPTPDRQDRLALAVHPDHPLTSGKSLRCKLFFPVMIQRVTLHAY